MHLHHAAQRLAPTRRKDTEVILCIGAVNTGAMILISIERDGWLSVYIVLDEPPSSVLSVSECDESNKADKLVLSPRETRKELKLSDTAGYMSEVSGKGSLDNIVIGSSLFVFKLSVSEPVGADLASDPWIFWESRRPPGMLVPFMHEL